MNYRIFFSALCLTFCLTASAQNLPLETRLVNCLNERLAYEDMTIEAELEKIETLMLKNEVFSKNMNKSYNEVELSTFYKDGVSNNEMITKPIEDFIRLLMSKSSNVCMANDIATPEEKKSSKFIQVMRLSRQSGPGGIRASMKSVLVEQDYEFTAYRLLYYLQVLELSELMKSR